MNSQTLTAHIFIIFYWILTVFCSYQKAESELYEHATRATQK